MNYLLKIEQDLYSTLHENTGLNVYTSVPEEVEFPFIKIGDMDTKEWLIEPKSYLLEFTLCAYTLENSNIKCIEIGEKIKRAIKLSTNNFIIQNTTVYQMKSGIWCTEIKIRTIIIEDKNV